MSEPFAHKKSLGQHFLNSTIVPEWLCAAGAVSHSDTVVEIGPGTGALTGALLKRGATVLAIETDRRALAVLEDTFRAEMEQGQLTLVKADVRTLALQEFGLVDHQFKIVANIPYYLSGHLFRVCLEHPVQPSDLVFLVQKEVAKRAALPLPPAKHGKGSLLALSLQAYGDVAIYKAVSRGHFTPPPSVDSAILAVRNINRDYFQSIDEVLFYQVIRAGFGHKRKQLQHNLKTRFSATYVEAALQAANLPSTIRAEDVSLAAWKQLVAVIQKW